LADDGGAAGGAEEFAGGDEESDVGVCEGSGGDGCGRGKLCRYGCAGRLFVCVALALI
jgi:hypothetical protein